MNQIIIRPGVKNDVPFVLGLIKELAEFEKEPQSVEVSEEQLINDGFGPIPAYNLLVAEYQQKIVGLSLFYFRYSTWKGKGLYLEDLIVTESFRGQGIGKKLILETAKFAKDNQCTGLYWQVLDWNTPAIDFYRDLGAIFDGEWVNCKLDQQTLSKII